VRKAVQLFCASVFCAASVGALAAVPGVQFSAQAQQSTPDKKSRHAKIYVGDNRVRLDYRQDGKTMVEIYDIENQRALLLVPEYTIYIEQEIPPEGLRNPLLPPGDGDANPCNLAPQAECQRLGEDTLYGKQVVLWEMTIRRDDQVLRSLHWIDEQRQMLLRQLWEDGTSSEMRPLGNALLDGRDTERWQLTISRDDVESIQSTQWYDPELEIVIREELPGGYFRELTDIQLAEQPAKLFRIPDSYRKMEFDSAEALQLQKSGGE